MTRTLRPRLGRRFAALASVIVLLSLLVSCGQPSTTSAAPSPAQSSVTAASPSVTPTVEPIPTPTAGTTSPKPTPSASKAASTTKAITMRPRLNPPLKGMSWDEEGMWTCGDGDSSSIGDILIEDFDRKPSIHKDSDGNKLLISQHLSKVGLTVQIRPNQSVYGGIVDGKVAFLIPREGSGYASVIELPIEKFGLEHNLALCLN